MLAATHLPDYRLEATGASNAPVEPAKYIIQFEAVGTETPTTFGWHPLFTLGSATGYLCVADDTEYLVETAFEFMEKAAHLLPYSDNADKAGDALMKQIRGNIETRPLTRRSRG